MTVRRRAALIGIATLLVAAVLVVAIRRALVSGLDPVARAHNARLNASERVLAYPITRDLPLVLALREDDTQIKLLTNLEVPEALAETASGEASAQPVSVAYGLRCEYLDAEGRVVWRGDYWEETRKTRVREPGELVYREEVFLEGLDRTVCDSRATHLLVAEPIRLGARSVRLRLIAATLAGEEQAELKVYARAFRAVLLTDEEAGDRWLQLPEARRDDLVGRFNLYPADFASDEERQRLMQRGWQIVPAEPHEGREHPTVAMYQTDFFDEYVRPREELRASSLAGPNRALSVNVVGPANLFIELGRQEGQDPRSVLGPTVPKGAPHWYGLRGLREDRVVYDERSLLASPAGGRRIVARHVPIPEGPCTITIHPENFRAHVRFYVDEVREVEGIEVTPVIGRIARGGTFWEIRPDVGTVTYYDAAPSEPGGPPIDAEVVAHKDGQPAELRLSTRVPVPPDARTVPRPFELSYEILGAEGRVLAADTLRGVGQASLYDWLFREEEVSQLLSEPVPFSIRCPAGARRLRLRSQESVYVALFSRLPVTDALVRVPEDQPVSDTIQVSRVLRGRLRAQTWYYYRPTNQYELGTRGRHVRVEVQRRLFEERAPEHLELRASNFYRALEPIPSRGAPGIPPVTLLEAQADEEAGPGADRLRVGDPWPLPPLVDARIRVTNAIDPRDARGVPVGIYCASRAPGARLLVSAFVDGERSFDSALEDGPLEARLGLLPPGEHRVRVEVFREEDGAFAPWPADAGAPPVVLYVDQPVLAREGEPDPEPLRLREAIPLRPGEAVAYLVEKHPAEPVVMNAAVYTEAGARRDRLTIEAVVEQLSGPGAPREALTRTFSIERQPEDGAMILRTGQPLGAARAFPLALDEQLEAGLYRVRFTVPADAGASAGRAAALIRAFRLDPGAPPIGQGYFARFNVKGPATLRVALDEVRLRERGVDTVRLLHRLQGPHGPAPVDARLVRVPPPGPVPLKDLAEPQRFARVVTDFDVPPGLHTLTVGSLADAIPARYQLIDRGLDALAGYRPSGVGGPRPLEVQADEGVAACDLARPGDPPLRFLLPVPRDERERAARWREAAEPLVPRAPKPLVLLPPVVTSTLAAVEPEDAAQTGPALLYGAPDPQLGAPYRIALSPILESVDEAAAIPVAARIRFLGADGAVLAEDLRALETYSVRGARILDGDGFPAEEVALYCVPPAGASRLEVEAVEGSLLVEVQAALDGAPPLYRVTPTDLRAPESMRLRTTPTRGDARFAPLSPEDAWTPEAAARRRTVARSRARLAAVIEEPADEDAGGIGLVPEAAPSRRRLLEPLDDGVELDHAGWSSSLFTQARARDRGVYRVVDPSGHGVEGTVYYDLGESVPEGELVVTVDGRTAVRALPLEPKGRLALPPLGDGDHEVSFLTEAGDARFLLNLPPRDLSRARPLRERQVFELREDAPLSVLVTKDGAEAQAVSGALYLEGPPPPGAELQLRLDAPLEGRVAGRALDGWTWDARDYSLEAVAPTEVVDLERMARAARRVYPFYTTLGPDLPPGAYELTLRLKGLERCEARLLLGISGARPEEGVRERAVAPGR